MSSDYGWIETPDDLIAMIGEELLRYTAKSLPLELLAGVAEFLSMHMGDDRETDLLARQIGEMLPARLPAKKDWNGWEFDWKWRF